MDTNRIFQKTSLGIEEIRSRTLKVSPKLRTMLILIDGRMPELVLKEKAALIGAPADFLDQLLKTGLIINNQPATHTANETTVELQNH